jgi:hypothetical protein
VPQGKIRFLISGAPHRPVRKPAQLRLIYSGQPLVRTPADVLAIILARCGDVLTADDLRLVARMISPPPAAPSADDRPPSVEEARRSPVNVRKAGQGGPKRRRRASAIAPSA